MEVPTAPRQHEVERAWEPERRIAPPSAGAPNLRSLSPQVVLALQRTAGNQAVARRVATAEPEAPAHASDMASPENRHLAADIDETDKLDDAALEKQHAQNAHDVAATDGAAHVAALEKRDALEYVAAGRGMAAPKVDTKLWPSVRTDPVKRRQFLNALLEEHVRAEGSFEKGLYATMFPDPSIAGDIAVFKADADRFASEFKSQARINAERMLRGSNQAIAQLLHSYGIPGGNAAIAAEHILKGGGVPEEAAKVVRVMKQGADEPGGANEAAPTTHRMRLAQWVAVLKKHQERVREATKQSNLADMNVSVASTPADNVALKARKHLRRERDALSGLWIQAERAHPVLAAYRTGGPLEKIELGPLDSKDVDVEMRTVLEQVLPKVVSIAKANALIRSGEVSPLSLAPVVAMTRANMFVPPGSIRAGVVRDLMEDAKDSQSTVVMILSFALALVTMIPTGGASVGVAAGAASVGLAAYSALKEFEGYENAKTLIDTDLDRARALSDEEPSLAGFAMSLIGLGLEGAMLVHAFKTAVQIRRMAMAAQESERLKQMLDELNKIGAKHNAPDLAERLMKDEAIPPRNAFSDAEKTQDMPAFDDPSLRRPPSAPKGVPEYHSHEEVRLAVTKRLLSNLEWGEGTMLSKEVKLIDHALAANPGPVNRKIAEALPHVIKGLRDPELYGEVMADAWALAKAHNMDINAAIEELARQGGAPIRYIEAKEGILDSPVFFQKYGGKPAHFIDLPLAADDHGAMSHVIQDLVVERALKRAGQEVKAVEFRAWLGQAEGEIDAAGFATKETRTFESGEQKMKTGDYIWRMLYDNTAKNQINRPESLGPQLFMALGVR
jgi:hypothetical protein